MTDQNYDELRTSERHAIDFEVEVSPASDQMQPFCDRTVLRNISGGGVCFSTVDPGFYAAGQKVNLKVFLPGTDQLDASMMCQGKVVWMHFAGQLDEEGRKDTLIGLCLDGFMSFESQSHQQKREEQSGGDGGS